MENLIKVLIFAFVTVGAQVKPFSLSKNIWIQISEKFKCYSKYFKNNDLGWASFAGQQFNATPIIQQQITKSSQVRMYAKTTENFIVLENLPANARVDVYNLEGRRVYSITSHTPLTTNQKLFIPVKTKGMYIATVSQQ